MVKEETEHDKGKHKDYPRKSVQHVAIILRKHWSTCRLVGYALSCRPVYYSAIHELRSIISEVWWKRCYCLIHNIYMIR